VPRQPLEACDVVVHERQVQMPVIADWRLMRLHPLRLAGGRRLRRTGFISGVNLLTRPAKQPNTKSLQRAQRIDLWPAWPAG